MHAKIRRINRFHVERLATFLRGLKDTVDAEGSLLDSCMIVYGSGISDGDRHDHHDLPILVAGRGGGALRPGRHVRYAKNTPLNDLHLALLEKLGAGATELGDGRGPLGGLG